MSPRTPRKTWGWLVRFLRGYDAIHARTAPYVAPLQGVAVVVEETPYRVDVDRIVGNDALPIRACVNESRDRAQRAGSSTSSGKGKTPRHPARAPLP